MMRLPKRRRFGQLLSIALISLAAVFFVSAGAQAETDCSQCHGELNAEVQRSVHDFLLCINCHTDISSFPHPEGAAVDKKESTQICSSCHQGRIADSYEESFHGKAVYLGSEKTASCVDCHGSHEIFPSDDPESAVNERNRAQTCAKCHQEAAPGFAQGTEHFVLAATGAGAPMYHTAKFFLWLTVIVMIALTVHIEMQLINHLRTILRDRKGRKNNG